MSLPMRITLKERSKTLYGGLPTLTQKNYNCDAAVKPVYFCSSYQGEVFVVLYACLISNALNIRKGGN